MVHRFIFSPLFSAITIRALTYARALNTFRIRNDFRGVLGLWQTVNVAGLAGLLGILNGRLLRLTKEFMLCQPMLYLYLKGRVGMPCGLARHVLYPVDQKPVQLGYSHRRANLRPCLFVTLGVRERFHEQGRNGLHVNNHIGCCRFLFRFHQLSHP